MMFKKIFTYIPLPPFLFFHAILCTTAFSFLLNNSAISSTKHSDYALIKVENLVLLNSDFEQLLNGIKVFQCLYPESYINSLVDLSIIDSLETIQKKNYTVFFNGEDGKKVITLLKLLQFTEARDQNSFVKLHLTKLIETEGKINLLKGCSTSSSINSFLLLKNEISSDMQKTPVDYLFLKRLVHANQFIVTRFADSSGAISKQRPIDAMIATLNKEIKHYLFKVPTSKGL